MINKSPGLHDGRPVGPLARALFRPLPNALSGGHFAPRGRISGRFCRPKGTNLFNMNAVINYKAPRRGLAVSFKQLPGQRTHAGYCLVYSIVMARARGVISTPYGADARFCYRSAKLRPLS